MVRGGILVNVAVPWNDADDIRTHNVSSYANPFIPVNIRGTKDNNISAVHFVELVEIFRAMDVM